ncbi:hypothetical protein IW261DRAFT_1422004 [Armillaria novae-zelandiae]|uniref:Uncharacterized protein n=1 Tax=Armillaria novae-zelandiae TaxID=153914 RepID=A0AA39P1A3_9AGAR|nr:hypothetical protein IW261DRAFT_1422004 [Armillaria novae-zelandiae]
MFNRQGMPKRPGLPVSPHKCVKSDAFEVVEPLQVAFSWTIGQTYSKPWELQVLLDFGGVPTRTLFPAEAHNMLKLYDTPTFQFRSPDQVIQFVQILANVDRQNPQWDIVRAQSFLAMIVDLKGRDLIEINQHRVLARIREVLQYSPVSGRAGTGFTALSFQTEYFPLLQSPSSMKNVNVLWKWQCQN